MELDDLKTAWAHLDQRVQNIELMARQVSEASQVRRLRRPLWVLGAGQAAQVAIGLLVAVVGGSFWFDHRETMHLLLAGVTLHAYGVLLIVTGGVQLAMIRTAYESAPVLEFQERVAKLRRARIVSGLVLGLPWWIMWVTVTIVGAAINGVDLYARATAWVWWNLGIGAAGMVLCWWLARRFEGKAMQSPKVQAVADSLSGRSLRQVASDLQEIDRFANEHDVSATQTTVATRS